MDAIVEDQDQMLDMKEVEEDIREGTKAFTKLQSHAAEGWQHWSIGESNSKQQSAPAAQNSGRSRSR